MEYFLRIVPFLKTVGLLYSTKIIHADGHGHSCDHVVAEEAKLIKKQYNILIYKHY